MSIDVIGWDIGGAHLKAVALSPSQPAIARQQPTPLWQGLDHLHQAIQSILQSLPGSNHCRHVITMTGELVDAFTDREQGVLALISAFRDHVPDTSIQIFAGQLGFIEPNLVNTEHIGHIASANWLATAMFTANRTHNALLVDIGSTTTDLLPIREGRPCFRGMTDIQRLRYQELVYTGVARTSLMCISRQAPWQGEWVDLMAEHFATTADVYRLTGELPPHADQMPTADGGAKSPDASARRIARLLGADRESASLVAWERLARYFRQEQLATIEKAVQRQLSVGIPDTHSCFVGAGVGRYLVQELAQRLGYPYMDFVELLPMQQQSLDFDLADCAPATSVACLLQSAS